ncbi:molybdopterin molybdotransferase MoeA [uncultured Maribacter sp.]|uniref:molybdopterin molybdotransferase MoeA n=1 Tax=uncultured Maribacter sp. TaxID=431308 RepID=UPI00260198EB|nr:molybdopterin molybdotransferase MoeA [uncultured Maribacter sp.]
MINFEDAFSKVLEHAKDFGEETVTLKNSVGRVLAETIFADRDFPPFNRSTKDGIALNYKSILEGKTELKIEGICSAGIPQQELKEDYNCLEIMTGAVLPKKADTIVMYEHVSIRDKVVTINQIPKQGINIHAQGTDEKKGAVLLSPGIRIDAAEVGILATVGKSVVKVKKLPKISVVSTGNELVPVEEKPLPHQIRKSNVLSIDAALYKEYVIPEQLHLADKKEEIKKSISVALKKNDALLLSGGVSKGKYDFIPEVMEELGVEKVFHRVAQKPGKPFWFGVHKETNTIIFSFPGNPVSTFANYHVYFLPWFKKSLGLPQDNLQVLLQEEIEAKPPLTKFVQVTTFLEKGMFCAKLINGNGSGDLTTLSNANGFVCLSPREDAYKIGELVPFIKVK